MGYGNGTRTHHSKTARSYSGGRVATVLSNDMVAHVWNAQSQTFGRSNNGNFYFEGPALYSYGNHFLVAYILPDGTALLNAESFSPSTSQHQGDAAGACRNRSRLYVPKLTDFFQLLDAVTNQAKEPSRERAARIKGYARELIERHAERLANYHLAEPGDWRNRWDEERGDAEATSAESAGAYLTRVAGLPARSWPALAKRAADAKAKRERAEAAKKTRNERESAARYADMSDSDFRRAMSVAGASYDSDARHRLESHAKALFHAVRTAKAAGFSARRRSILSERHKTARARLADFETLFRIVNARRQLAADIKTVHGARVFVERQLPELGAWQVRSAGENFVKALRRLADSPALPFRTRRRLSTQATRAAGAIERLATEAAAREEAERLAAKAAREMEAAEHRAAWLAGEVPLLGRRFDAETGGAALRIIGDRLETSHGATVPLRHAIRAFQFVKLCKALGRPWRRNGEHIRVGSFEIDTISESGDMVAGCHEFTWPEIARAAKAAGVYDFEASAEAIEKRAA